MVAGEAVSASASAVGNRRPALWLLLMPTATFKRDADRLILLQIVLVLLRPKADTDTDRENIIKALLLSIIVIVVSVVRVSANAEATADAPSFIFFVRTGASQAIGFPLCVLISVVLYSTLLSLAGY